MNRVKDPIIGRHKITKQQYTRNDSLAVSLTVTIQVFKDTSLSEILWHSHTPHYGARLIGRYTQTESHAKIFGHRLLFTDY